MPGTCQIFGKYKSFVFEKYIILFRISVFCFECPLFDVLLFTYINLEAMPRTVEHLQYSLSSQKRRKLEDFVNKTYIILSFFLEKPKKRNDTPWPKDTESKIQSLTGLSGK